MQKLIDNAKKAIPPQKSILDEAFSELKLTTSQVRKNFGKSLLSIDKTATKIYLSYEKSAIQSIVESWLLSQNDEVRQWFNETVNNKDWDSFIEHATKRFTDFANIVQPFEKVLGNMRKSRGGRTFEDAIIRLVLLLGKPIARPTGKNKDELGKIDLVLPDVETAKKTPDRALFITCKRTLRERWKQEIPTGKSNWRYYLLTIDPDISQGKAEEIHEKSLIAYVLDDVKKNKQIEKMPWIRPLSEFPKEIL